MTTTVTTLKTRIADTINRSNLGSLIAGWLETAHHTINQTKDWQAQEAEARFLASAVTYSFTVPTDFKASRPPGLVRTAGVSPTSEVIPTKFYGRRGFTDLLVQRSEADPSVAHPNLIEDDLEAIWDLDQTSVRIFPKNTTTTDQFVFFYYKMLPLPADVSSDWFTDNAFDYLLYESLLQGVPALGGNDDRIKSWTSLRDRALQRVIGLDIERRLTGASLMMRG